MNCYVSDHRLLNKLIREIHKLPFVLQVIIATYYGGYKYPKRDYIVFNNIKKQATNIKKSNYCKYCGNFIRTRYTKSYLEKNIDYLTCLCFSNKVYNSRYVTHHNNIQDILIPWIMVELEKNDSNRPEINRRLSIAQKIISDYRIIIYD